MGGSDVPSIDPLFASRPCRACVLRGKVLSVRGPCWTAHQRLITAFVGERILRVIDPPKQMLDSGVNVAVRALEVSGSRVSELVGLPRSQIQGFRPRARHPHAESVTGLWSRPGLRILGFDSGESAELAGPYHQRVLQTCRAAPGSISRPDIPWSMYSQSPGRAGLRWLFVRGPSCHRRRRTPGMKRDVFSARRRAISKSLPKRFRPILASIP